MASPLVSFGDTADLYFNGSASLASTSNLFRTEDNEEDDIMFTVTPGLELNLGRGRSAADLTVIARYEIREYFDNSELDTELFGARAFGSYRSSRLDLSGSVGFREQKNATGSGGDAGQFGGDLIESEVFDARVDGEYRVSPKFSFGAGVGYTDFEYQDPFNEFLQIVQRSRFHSMFFTN